MRTSTQTITVISNWKSVLNCWLNFLVPQGSVLGPILFLIYINYLEDDIPSKVLKFADDTQVFRKVTNDTDKQSSFNKNYRMFFKSLVYTCR